MVVRQVLRKCNVMVCAEVAGSLEALTPRNPGPRVWLTMAGRASLTVSD